MSAPAQTTTPAAPTLRLDPTPTGFVALADGLILRGVGFGAGEMAVGELCFNTAMTGYQEILTDPSYADQLIAFTFPHIGNVGATDEDDEAAAPAARGLITRELPTGPSNWRAQTALSDWLAARGRVGVAGIDTRALTRRIRTKGMPHAAIAHAPSGDIDLDALVATAQAFESLDGRDLATSVTTPTAHGWDAMRWRWPSGAPRQEAPSRRVVAVDYGAKRNILRLLAEVGCAVDVVPADADLQTILDLAPDGVFLSNGPGDPAATAAYAAPVIQGLLERKVPVFGICLGHQLLGLALGAKTVKMPTGHHGANHPVKEIATGKVEVTSMNHGFAVDAATLPPTAEETHVSLFDGSNSGLRCLDRPAFSVQHHPEASPGPQDSHYLFRRFADMIDATRRNAL